jgi:galactokinase
MAEALRRGDLAAAGRLMDASHASLRELYEVSSAELDLITELARRHPACHGARLTGAGFGGCAIALVDAEAAEGFAEVVHAGYRAGRAPECSLRLPSASGSACLRRLTRPAARRARLALFRELSSR